MGEGTRRVTVEEVVVTEIHEEPKPAITDLGDFLKRTEAVVPVAILGIFLIGFVGFLFFARAFLMPVILAVMLSFLLKPMVRFLAGIHIPEALGAGLIMGLFFGTLFFAASNLIQPATQWIARAPETMRAAEVKFQKLMRPAKQLSRAAASVEHITKAPDEPETQKIEIKSSHMQDTILGYTKSFLTGAAETIVLLYFLLASGDLFMQKLVRILPTLRNKKKAVEIANELQQNISTFLFTISLINVGLGIAVGLAVMFVGLPNPVLWGVVAGLLNFIPYFGPIIGVLVLALAGFVSFDTLGRAAVPPLIYFACHAIESNFITPMILGRRLTLNPVVIFISLIFWTWIWGIPGALLSIPVLMTVKILCDHFKPLAAIGEFLSGDARKSKAEEEDEVLPVPAREESTVHG